MQRGFERGLEIVFTLRFSFSLLARTTTKKTKLKYNWIGRKFVSHEMDLDFSGISTGTK